MWNPSFAKNNISDKYVHRVSECCILSGEPTEVRAKRRQAI